MFNLPVRTWVLNAAAVFSGRHGNVTRQAAQAGCSRETVYEHARKVEQRLELDSAARAELGAANQRLRQEIARLECEAASRVLLDKDMQRQFVVNAFAMGVSLRQIEELLGVLLTPSQAPDHATLGRWVQAEAEQAGRVLAVLDAACVDEVATLAVDEIFFGGGRLWSGSSRRA